MTLDLDDDELDKLQMAVEIHIEDFYTNDLKDDVGYDGSWHDLLDKIKEAKGELESPEEGQ